MMKQVVKKWMAVVMLMAFGAGSTTIFYPIQAETVTGDVEKEYIITVEDEEEYTEITSKYMKNIMNDYAEYKSAHKKVIHMNLGEAEKESLARESNGDIELEKNITFCASGHGKKTNRKVKSLKSDAMDWNLRMIGADSLKQNKISTRNRIKIAVMDSGIDFSKDIPVVERVNLVDKDSEVAPWFEDTTGHGTSVASIIADVNPQAEIYSVKILDNQNCATLDRVVEGIYWCVDHDIDIINMSFGTSQNTVALKEAVKKAEQAGILMIASAGNDAQKPIEYPGAYDDVMAVGSVDKMAQKTEESAFGDAIEIVAPGKEVPTEGAYGGTLVAGGTSIAAAHVSGVASVIWQEDKGKNYDFVRGLIQYSAKGLGEQSLYGNGLLDVKFAIKVYKKYARDYARNAGTDKEALENYLPENTEAVLTFDDVELVQGRWDSEGHNTILDSANAQVGFGANEIQVMKRASAAVDDKDFDLAAQLGYDRTIFGNYTNLLLHGRYNYVATVKYLYEVAMMIARTDDSVTIHSICNSIHYNPNIYGNDKLNQQAKARLKEAIVLMASADMTQKLKDDNLGLNWRTRRAFRIIGMMMHVVSDTYAHKTKVPLGVSHSAQGGVMSIKNSDLTVPWSTFYNEVKKGIMFNRITKRTSSTPKYEDKSNFYPNRFEAAKTATNLVLRHEAVGATTVDVCSVFTVGAILRNSSICEENLLAFFFEHAENTYGTNRANAVAGYGFRPGISEYE